MDDHCIPHPFFKYRNTNIYPEVLLWAGVIPTDFPQKDSESSESETETEAEDRAPSVAGEASVASEASELPHDEAPPVEPTPPPEPEPEPLPPPPPKTEEGMYRPVYTRLCHVWYHYFNLGF